MFESGTDANGPDGHSWRARECGPAPAVPRLQYSPPVGSSAQAAGLVHDEVGLRKDGERDYRSRREFEAGAGRPSRVRLIGARVLTILAILLALVGMVAFYVEHTALDEDGFETISRKMIENDEIRTQVAAKSVDTLFTNVDVEAAIAERLPPAQAGLAPVLAGLARSGADRAADAALERPRVQTVWVEVTTGRSASSCASSTTTRLSSKPRAARSCSTCAPS